MDSTIYLLYVMGGFICNIIYLLYVMGGFICNISLLYVNPLFVLCEIYIIV
jgi:hypothetical protein